VGQQPPTYPLLLSVWERRYLGDCLFECLHHEIRYNRSWTRKEKAAPSAQPFEPFKRAFLVRPHQPRIAGDIGREDRREPSFDASWSCGLHGASSVAEDPLHRRARCAHHARCRAAHRGQIRGSSRGAHGI
jgi:hypothetical protein